MSAIIFDGRKFAAGLEEQLKGKIGGRKLKLVTILNPEHQPSVVYTKIKVKMAQKIGVDFLQLPITVRTASNFQLPINEQIIKLNNDQSVDGMMIQQPLVGDKEKDQELCNLIAPEKDVDGLGENSKFMPATCRAALEILNSAIEIQNSKLKICVVGNQGTVGSRLEKELRKDGRFKVSGMDKKDFDPGLIREADVVISATGQAGLIKPEMVKNGVIAIDVGYPVGDFASEVAGKASFMTPVPGGVGPVTVVMLFKNLIGNIDI